MASTTILGTIVLLTNFLDVGAFISPDVGPTLSNCNFEIDRCEWRPYDTTYNHPMQWIITDDDMLFAVPPKGSWFAAIEMGNVPNLTLNATFMCAPFKLDDIETLKINFNYFFWIDPRNTEYSPKLSLKYQTLVGNSGYRNHIQELWNVTSSAGIHWNTQTIHFNPYQEWIAKFWFLAEVFNTNRVKFAIDEFAVEVIKKPPTTTTVRTNANL